MLDMFITLLFVVGVLMACALAVSMPVIMIVIMDRMQAMPKGKTK